MSRVRMSANSSRPLLVLSSPIWETAKRHYAHLKEFLLQHAVQMATRIDRA